MNIIAQTIMINGLKYAMKTLREYMSEESFKEIGDKILNAVEGYFPEGSFGDTAVEIVTAGLREELGIPDSNPDN